MNKILSNNKFKKIFILLFVILISAGVVFIIIDISALGTIIGFTVCCTLFDAVLVVLYFELYYWITDKISTKISVFKYILAGVAIGLIEILFFFIYFIKIFMPQTHDVEGAIIIIYVPILIVFSISGSLLAAYFDSRRFGQCNSKMK